MIQVLYFARLRESVDCSQDHIDPASLPGNTVADLKAHLAARGGRWESEFAENSRLLASVNQDMAQDNTVIPDGAEVGFFPPVTGG